MKIKDPAIKIAFRNLIRQKRRNILLGGAIALGMAILIVVGSFGNGLSDSLLNRLLVNMAGHIQVSMAEKKGDKTLSVIRDQAALRQKIQAVLPKAKIKEEIGTFASALGNGISDNLMLSGVAHADQSFEDFLHLTAGNFADFTNGGVEYPVILYESKADTLKVKIGDVIRVKMHTYTGQVQSATLQIVGIAASGNPFAEMTGYVPLKILKKLLAYQPWETSYFSITIPKLKNPALAILYANKLREAFKPRPLLVSAKLQKQQVVLADIKTSNISNKLPNFLQVLTNDETGKLVLSKKLAKSLNIRTGQSVQIRIPQKYDKPVSATIKVAGLSDKDSEINGKEIVWMSSTTLFSAVQSPIILTNTVKNFPIDIKYLAGEWQLAKRSTTSKEWRKKIRNRRNKEWSGPLLDVTSMYEIADQVLQMQGVIKMVSFYAVLVLFIIILIGVANSMRMNIRERTREIGTMRAIGMQRKSVRNVFLFEAILLAFFASLIGGIFGLIFNVLLSLPTFQVKTMIAIFLNKGHMVFIPTVGDFVSGMILILILTGITAYFPSRRAAKMLVSDALRHSE